jgi:hypothetical protein
MTENNTVPPVSTWPSLGIIGKMHAGPLVGDYIWIEPLWNPGDKTLLYQVNIPVPNMYVDNDPTKEDIVDDGAVSVFYDDRPSLIHELTDELSIEWSTDPLLINKHYL